MTSAYLIPDIEADEGFRAEAYPDPLSHGEPWSVGYGSTGPGITQGTVWTQAQAEADLIQRVATLTTQLAANLPWFVQISDLRQDVLVNMAYNMGLAGLLAFHKTLTLISEADYTGAATDMLQSLWAKQVPNRAKRLSDQMASGLYAGVNTGLTLQVEPGVKQEQIPVPLQPIAAPVSIPPTAGAIISPVVAPNPQAPVTQVPADPPIQLPSQIVAQVAQLGTHFGAVLAGVLGTAGLVAPNQEAQIAAFGGSLAVLLLSIGINAGLQYFRHTQAEKAVAQAKAS